MDKTEIKCRFRRSVESYEENATVQKLIAERLFQLLEKYSEEVLFRILEVGCGTGLFTRKLKRKCEDSILVINDIMSRWLEGFSYKTPLHWWIFLLAGVITLLIALFTVSWQSWKAATENPVKALKSE